jgi:hypothetical protein
VIAMRRRYLDVRFGGLLTALLVMGGLIATVGCGGSSTPSATTTAVTPAGTYSVVMTANAVNGIAATTQQFTATVTVTQ